MTKDEILSMKPGRELDAMVEQEIFGNTTEKVGDTAVYTSDFKWCMDDDYIITIYGDDGWPKIYSLPEYSENIKDAFEVVAKIQQMTTHDTFALIHSRERGWSARLHVINEDGLFGVVDSGQCDTPEEAICKLALLAVME